MAWNEDDLHTAENHVRRGREIVQRQKEMIAALRTDGHDTATAESFLVSMEQTLQTFERHRDTIKQAIESEGAP